MRRKVKVKKKISIPKWIYLLGGYFSLFIIAIFHLLNFIFKLYELFPILPKYSLKNLFEASVFVGGPVFIFFASILSIKSKKLCGALLLFGSALISFGFAFQSGYFIKIYILKMEIVALPQILSSLLFLIWAKR